MLLHPAGRLNTVAGVSAGYAGFDGLSVEWARSTPTGQRIVGLLVPPEIPSGPACWPGSPDLRIVAAASTGYVHLDLDARARPI